MAKLEPIIFDFETYFNKKLKGDLQYSLSKLSYPEYIYDSRFQVHLLGVDRNGKQDFIAPRDIPKFLKGIKGAVVIGHNLFFDAAILAWRYDWRAERYIDTLSLANHYVGPARESSNGRNDLDTLARKLGIAVQKKDLSFMDGVAVPTPGDLLRLKEYLGTDLTITRKVADKLLPRIANAELELWLIDHTLRIFLDRQLAINPKQVTKTRKLVNTRLAERVKASGTTPAVLASNPQFATELRSRLKKYNVKMPTKRGKNSIIPALAKDDPGFLKLAEHPIKPIADLVRGRLVLRSSANVLARLNTMDKFHERGIPVHLVYYGAHTGRWSAAGGFNFLNLTSPDRANDPVDREIAKSIRESIEADTGETFVAADASQIEKRVLAWLAEESKLERGFANGDDIYSEFISDVLDEDIHKPTGKEKPAVAAHLTLMRGAGKIAVLGLGFNMGVDKFFTQLRSKSPGIAKMIADGRIDLKFAGKVVEKYRKTYTEIVKFWTVIEDAFKRVLAGGEDEHVGRGGALRIERIDDTSVGIALPSGRILYYRNLRWEQHAGTRTFVGYDGKRVTRTGNNYELRFGNGKKIYGGLLTENVVQAIARDIMVLSIRKMELAKFPVVLHVYDEIVAQVKKGKAKKAEALLVKSLSTPPPWGQGMILAAEGRTERTLSK